MIKNFRPFYGEQKIEFSESSKEKFTIIEAKSDTGKTSLLSAISWCLYEKDIGRKDKATPSDIYNLQRKDELSEGDIDSLKVEITLNEEDSILPKFIIEREGTFKKLGSRMVPTKTISMKIHEWNDISNDATIYENQHFCNVIINSILPEDIHMFFLFEGEKLEKYFSLNNSENIRSSIEKISQIEYVRSAHDHLKKSREKVHNKKDESKGNKECFYNQERIDSLKVDIDKKSLQIQEYENAKSKANSRIKEIDDELINVSPPLIKEWSSKRKKLESEISRLEIDYGKTKKEILATLVKIVPYAICNDALEYMFKKIDKTAERNELPPKIKNVYIKELLDKKVCICGRDLDPNHNPKSIEACELLNNMLQQNDLSDQAQLLLEGKYDILKLLKEMPEKLVDERRSRLNKLNDIRTTITDKEAEIKDYSGKLKNVDEERIKALNTERERLREGVDTQNQTIGRIRSEIKRKEGEVTDLINENENIMKKMQGYEQTKKVAEFMERAIEHLDSIHKDILVEVRKTVEAKTFDTFKNIHWDRINYIDFSINSDYQMRLKDKNKNEKILDLSSGTKQALLLSYIAALSEVSGFKFPIFIDSPLANTDNEQRMNIAEKLPNYLKDNQVVLLVKDQEYTPEFRQMILSRVDKEIKLEKEGASTLVKPCQ